MNKEFLSILKRSEEIHHKKNQDYTSGTNVDENFERVAEIVSWFKHPIDKSFAGFIAVKLARIASLLNKSDSPKFESIDDTFVDLVTYAGLWGGNVARRLNAILYENIPYHQVTKEENKSFLGFDKASFEEEVIPLNNLEKRELELSRIALTYQLNEEDLSQLISLARILKSRYKSII